MQRSQRLTLVVTLAERDKDKAAQNLQACLEILREEQQRLRDLQGYYSEYEQRFRHGTHALRADQLAANREFLKQLNESCQLQQQHLTRVQQQVDNAKKIWAERHLKHQNLEQYVDRLRREEQALEDKREQKRSDEWVGQRFGVRRDDR